MAEKSNYVYVVARDKRRVSHNNHPTHTAACEEAELWQRVKANWDPSTKVEILKTDEPHTIR